MNIVLIGYRGAGKSTIANILGRETGLRVVSIDAEIEKREGLPIGKIVEQRGWEHFRDREAEAIERCATGDGAIIDAGGGVVLRPENVARLKENGVCFWLRADIETLRKRIGAGSARPSLTGGQSARDEVEKVLQERLPLYEMAADYVIDTDVASAEDAANTILRRFETHQEASESLTGPVIHSTVARKELKGMRVQTFIGKIGVEALEQMDEHINRWLERNKVEPKFITQTCGSEQYHESGNTETVVITSIWY